METTETKQAVERKRVFVCVPIEKHDGPIIERAIQVAKKEYCKARNVSPKDVIFFDYIRDLKPAIDAEKEDGVVPKNEGLGTVGYMISLMEVVDDAIFGVNWQKSRSCKVAAKAAEVYMVPHIKIMIGEKKKEIEESEEVQEYRKRHNITVIWKE